ncbi:MAG: hypothetical protein BWZ02_00507 [Lentisphaerae bacterium ADurb.BinA184]|nr:MAG: hypothetical protein BWZ02_00507 [Lentisphaerae bacterium ADurb.BinA184]
MGAYTERLIAGDFPPVYRGGAVADYQAQLDNHMTRLRRKGATHVMVNRAVCSIPWAMDPENSYLRFTTYGHTPDKYVTSTYNVGIYHEELLAANRQLLLQAAALARAHGLRCAVRCVEMTLMPESFFRRHPALRGPRVDNPACSTTPYYALCPMLPEVQDHYRQLIRNLLNLVPEIDEMHIFTNDSGAGFCYSSHLYAGPNGPYHCKDVPPGRQAQEFARVLVAEGRKVNPEFRVVMTSGLAPSEKEDFLRGAPDGVAASVYGAFAWGGGLEWRWGTQAVGPGIHTDRAERERTLEWQRADYEARVRQIQAHGGTVYASYNSDYYAGDDPRPYETHEIVSRLLSWGVRNLIGGGPGTTPYSANTAVIRRAMEHGPEPTDAAVRAVAQAWVGAGLADELCAVWRLSDLAAREQPVPPGGHALALQPLIIHMPIVPDEERLGPHDLDYFLTPVLRDQGRMKSHQGGVWRILHYGAENRLAYLRQYESAVFAPYTQALTLLEGLLARPGLNAEQRACFEEQRAIIADYERGYRHLTHWLMAAFHRIDGEPLPDEIPPLSEIIAREIAWAEGMDRAAGRDPAANPRIGLMKAHQSDPVRRVALSPFPPHRHLGVEGWEGAHVPQRKG